MRKSNQLSQKSWERYEQVAQQLLHRFAEHFGLGRVEGKQLVPGESTDWKIDAKGVREGSDGFLIIECRRWKNNIRQEDIGALAFRITDTEAEGGLMVSPVSLQSGAKRIAEHTNIQSVFLSRGSTTVEYVMQFLDRIFVGLSDTAHLSESLSTILRDEHGNVKE